MGLLAETLLFPLFAQVGAPPSIAESAGVDWGDVLRANGQWIFLIVCVAGGIITGLVGMLIGYRSHLLKHEERMAMIDAGMHPDDPAAAQKFRGGTDGDPMSETSDYS